MKAISKLALFWEMRLGKTLIAIRWLKTRPDCNKIIIACPLSVVDSWERELVAEGETPIVVRGTTAQKEKTVSETLDFSSEARQWVITNYESFIVTGRKSVEGKALATPSYLCALLWHAVVADESTVIKNAKAQITKVFIKQFKHTPYRAVLTGLPNPEGLQDFVTQLIFVHGAFMGCDSFWDWRLKHMMELPTGGHIVKRSSAKMIAKSISKLSHSLTRKEAGIGSIKLYSIRTVEIPGKVKTAIKKLHETSEIGNKLTKLVLENLTIEAKLTGGFYDDASLQHNAKLKELKYLLSTELRGQPFIIWCRFTDEVKGVTDYLNKMKPAVRVASVFGKSAGNAQKSVKLNRERIDLFMDGKLDGLVCQPKCVQMGIDMSRASVAIYYSRWLGYSINAQSSDRIVHPKKKEPILEIDIVARETYDNLIPSIISDKRTNSGNFNDRLVELMKERGLE